MARGAALLLLVVSLASAGEAPRALVLEHEDPHVRAVGAAALLREAGFDVAGLDPAAWPKAIAADIVMLGTFCTERAEARAAVREHAGALLEFVRRGGVLLEMTQDERDAPVPPFLPEGTLAWRSDRDHGDVLALGPAHPLLDGLVAGGRMEIPARASGHPCWESFAHVDGFRILLAASSDGDAPCLLEAAAGKGRVLLASLCLDKAFRTDGKPAVSEEYLRVSRRFFGNLRRYVADVMEARAPPVVPFSAYALPEGPRVDLAWRLAPSDAATYSVSTCSSRGDEAPREREGTRMVFGHDLRDARQYRGGTPRLADLAATLALRVPPAAESWGIPFVDASTMRVRGTASASATTDDTAVVVARYVFESVGDDDQPRVRGGEARVRVRFDRKEGVARHACGELSYTLRRPDRKEAPTRVRESFEFRLKEVRRARHKGFQAEVDAAIERGVKHLCTLQKEDGTFEPHGDYVAGTTALALFTLSSCGVAREDPAVAKALDWLCAQEPRRTYELAVGLMALERAYPPTRDGRGMPDDRREWCARTLLSLEKACGTPGSWGYPAGSGAVMKFDSSNTQYAALGLHAAGKLGLPVREAMWTGLVNHFKLVRERGGARGGVGLVRQGEAVPDAGPPAVDVPEIAGFRYWPGERRVWGSMTCAGIASLALARHELARIRKLTPRLKEDIDAMVLGGWAWLDAHWGMDRHPAAHFDDWYGYYLYSLERAAVFDSVKRVGLKDWYYEGALQLLARQRGDGGWNEPGSNRTCGTSFALLFLKKATQPLSGARD